jgi:hypothetical protein
MKVDTGTDESGCETLPRNVGVSMAVLWVTVPCSLAIIALLMEATNTAEMSVKCYRTTRRRNPEDSIIHT